MENKTNIEVLLNHLRRAEYKIVAITFDPANEKIETHLQHARDQVSEAIYNLEKTLELI